MTNCKETFLIFLKEIDQKNRNGNSIFVCFERKKYIRVAHVYIFTFVLTRKQT